MAKNKIYPDVKHDAVLVIDGMNLAYRAFYAYKKLQGVEIIYGVPQMIRAAFQYGGSWIKKIVVVWDGKRHPARIERWPEYKSHRSDRPEGFNQQLKEVRKLLYKMGIPQVLNREIEGDDMIHLVTEKYKKAYKVKILSGDKDFRQLIDKRVCIQEPGENGNGSWGVELFKAYTSLDRPSQFVDYLCLVGDKSDDIRGYPQIGPAKAILFLSKFKSIKNFLEQEGVYFSIIQRKKLRRIWKRNRFLIDLKRFCDKQGYTSEDITYYKERTQPEFDEVAYLAFCAKYKMRSMMVPSFFGIFRTLANE